MSKSINRMVVFPPPDILVEYLSKNTTLPSQLLNLRVIIQELLLPSHLF